MPQIPNVIGLEYQMPKLQNVQIPKAKIVKGSNMKCQNCENSKYQMSKLRKVQIPNVKIAKNSNTKCKNCKRFKYQMPKLRKIQIPNVEVLIAPPNLSWRRKQAKRI